LGRLYTFSLMVSGASSFKRIWWSQAWLGGNLSASCSEKTLACLLYSAGIGVSFLSLSVLKVSAIFWAIVVFRACMATLCISYASLTCSWATAPVVLRVVRGPRSLPSAQLISGLNALSHGYPKISRSRPRFVICSWVWMRSSPLSI
jgi:hypothetical protein